MHAEVVGQDSFREISLHRAKPGNTTTACIHVAHVIILTCTNKNYSLLDIEDDNASWMSFTTRSALPQLV